MIYLLLSIFVFGGYTSGVIEEVLYKPPDNQEILNKSLITFNNFTYNLTIVKEFLPDWYIETDFMFGRNIRSIDFTLGKQWSKYFRILGGFKTSQLDLDNYKSTRLDLYFAIRHYNTIGQSSLWFMIDGRFVTPYSVILLSKKSHKVATVLFNMHLGYKNFILLGIRCDMFANHSKYARYMWGDYPTQKRLYWPFITRGRYVTLYMGIRL